MMVAVLSVFTIMYLQYLVIVGIIQNYDTVLGKQKKNWNS